MSQGPDGVSAQGLPCPGCKSVPVKRGSVACGGCGRLYHNSCAERAAKTEDGTVIAFVKCCGPNANSAPSGAGVAMTADELK